MDPELVLFVYISKNCLVLEETRQGQQGCRRQNIEIQKTKDLAHTLYKSGQAKLGYRDKNAKALYFPLTKVCWESV